MKFTVLTLACLLSLQLVGQENLNLELVANVPTVSSANDIWGFVDQEGIEYAIVGTRDNTLVFSLETPSAPELLLTLQGTNTTWRDMKSYGNFVYTVTDNTDDGLQILDMTSPRDSIPVTTVFPEFSIDTLDFRIVHAHNLFVDENGILCMTGSNELGGAPILLDVAANPADPQVVGYVIGEYAHDIYIENNILYASEIFAGQLSIYDITDRINPVLLGAAPTSFEFTHNAWLSEDNTHIFTTDERSNAFVDAYDITDFDDIKRVSTIRPRRNGNGVVPHNTHYHEGFLVTSWYGDGVVVVDANKPDNLVIVGRYDTNTDAVDGFVGCWGAYPFLPSGLVLASDRQFGLYVLQPTYERAAYFEGCVVDATTGEPLSDVEIRIPSTEVFGTTDVMGVFRSGHSEEGVFQVIFQRNGYQTIEVDVNLVSGEVTELKVELFPADLVNLDVTVVNAVSGEVVPEAQVEIIGTGFDFTFDTDDTGIFNTSIFVGDYQFTIGAWGFLHKVEQIRVDGGEIVLEIQPGFQDDFYFDLGWVKADGSKWERLGDDDVDFDLGTLFYQNFDPLDDGGLMSPAMDLSGFDFPVISFSARLFTSGANLVPSLVIGGETIPAFQINDTGFNFERFELHVFNTVSEGTDLSEVFFLFDTEITAALDLMDVDAFLVEEGSPSSTTQVAETQFSLSPNPASDNLTLTSVESNAKVKSIEIFDIDGRRVSLIDGNESSVQNIDVSTLLDGVYLLCVKTAEGQIYSKKFIKN